MTSHVIYVDSGEAACGKKRDLGDYEGDCRYDPKKRDGLGKSKYFKMCKACVKASNASGWKSLMAKLGTDEYP